MNAGFALLVLRSKRALCRVGWIGAELRIALILFQWNAGKSELNRQKHGVSFQEALAVFFDDASLEYFDIDHSQIEDRFWIIGAANSGRILFVVYTFRRSVHGKENSYYFRIISARAARKNERNLYFQRG